MDTSRKSKATGSRLLAADQQGSVLNALVASQSKPLAYSPYGYRQPASGLLSLLGFNGEYQDPVTGHYLLGTGYHRAFNPVLMRLNSPDSWSPFGEGGLNAYAYLLGDPVNDIDPSGHMGKKGLLKNALNAVSMLGAGARPGSTPPQDSVAPSGSKRSQVSPADEPSNLQAAVGSRKSSVASSTGSGSRKNSLAVDQSDQSRKSSISSLSSLGSVRSESQVEGINENWTYSKRDADYIRPLTRTGQETFDKFQNAIHNEGKHPILAAKGAGATNYKQLDRRFNLYQIRLDVRDRLTFILEERQVTIRQVGGHT